MRQHTVCWVGYWYVVYIVHVNRFSVHDLHMIVFNVAYLLFLLQFFLYILLVFTILLLLSNLMFTNKCGSERSLFLA